MAFYVPRKLRERVQIEAIKRRLTIEKICTEAIQNHLDGLRKPKEAQNAA